MRSLKNTHADMEIGYIYVNGELKLFIQVGKDRKYYGTLHVNKKDEFLEMLQKWDEAGGNDA